MFLSESSGMNPAYALVPWVVFAPLAGILINLVLGKRLGEKFSGAVACLASASAFGVAVFLLVSMMANPEAGSLRLADWITVGSLQLSWAFRVDTLSVVMMLVVSGVGTLIHIYASAYMHDDVRHNGDPARYRRFFVYFNLFLMAMMLLVTADNYLMLFVGWEGVGLCSYLLIGFWFEKGDGNIANAQAAKKAFVVNRIGDFGLLLALFILFWSTGTLQFDEVFKAAEGLPQGVVLAVTLLMLLGVAGKSAQLPLYVWLPDAMAGPTPVSALIHAATMVTAGVYLVARSSPLYQYAPVAQNVVMWVGALTALFAATIAVGQHDIKKVLAYSTISQLGFMVAAVGMGAFVAGMFHLVTHAFFKALLFLSAGSVILGMERGTHAAEHGSHGDVNREASCKGREAPDPQDMRNMGGLQAKMPLTFWVYLIGALALAGIAPLAGFFSKDEILTAAQQVSLPVFVILLVSAFLTAFYMGRQVLMVFFGKPRSPSAGQATESSLLITLPLVMLAVLSVVGGALNLPGVLTLEHWLEHSLEGVLVVEFSWVVAIVSTMLAWWVYGRRAAKASDADPLALSFKGLFTALERKWWVDELYHAMFVRPYNVMAEWTARVFDQGGIDGVVNGLGGLTNWLAQVGSRLQTGFVRTYALFVLLGVVAILSYLALR
jgi:NADH-quinone oxidoreductase subunit L